jgi:hypothetical protein
MAEPGPMKAKKTAPGYEKFRCQHPSVKNSSTSSKLRHNSTKFPDTVTKKL